VRPEFDNFLKAALAAVEPGQAVRRALAVDDGLLVVGGQEYQFSDFRRVIGVGAGKASAPMAAAVEELLGNLLSVEGSVTVRYGHSAPTRHVRDSEKPAVLCLTRPASRRRAQHRRCLSRVKIVVRGILTCPGIGGSAHP